MKTTIAAALCALTLFGTAGMAKEPDGLKKRIAVFTFEDKSDHKVRWWNHGQSVGDGMADMLITALVKEGKYRIMERSQIDQIMKEHALGASGAVTPETAAKMGSLLGVELAVVGSVTEFGYKESKTGGSIGGFAAKALGMGSGMGASVNSVSAVVGIDIRFVDVSTGEILAAESVNKKESSKGLSFSTATLDFENEKKFDESVVGKATRAAINEMVEKIGKQMDNVRWSGRVIKASGNSVIINAGSATGVKVGDELLVYQKGEELIDPETGISLGSEETQIGKIKVKSDMANGKASKCDLIEGSGGKNGDLVKYPK